MARFDDTMKNRAARFLWTSGRVLEQRRFAYLFGGETESVGVLTALDAYRSTDGGYAFGLEPDVRGPAGQPISLPSVLKILEETGALKSSRATRLCDWLTGATAPDGGVPAVLPSLRPYPHPPWLPLPDEPAGDLLTTGQIVGPLLSNEIKHPWLETATNFCRTAVENLRQTHPYEVMAAIAFLDGVPDRRWAKRQAARLGELVHEQRIVLLDPTRPEEARISPGYAAGELHLPHDYARRPGSVARSWFSETELEHGLDHLAAEQQEDGGWPIHRARWTPTTEVQARPGTTLTALLTLSAYDEGLG